MESTPSEESQPKECSQRHKCADVDSNSSHWKPGRAEYAIVFSLGILCLLVALDSSILVSALPIITSELHGTTTEAFWAGASYLLTSAVFQPFIVAMSNDFGRRSLLFISVLLFTVGTALCCSSQSFSTLLAGRTVQGIGGGGILSLNNVILTDIIPLRQRPSYIVITQLAWAFGTIIGPLIGGLFAEYATWRWIFYINFPFCAVGLSVVPFSVKLHADVPSVMVRLKRLDWIGMVLFTSSTTSFLIGITWGGSQYPWSSVNTLLPIALGVLGFVATVLWEAYGTERPILLVSLLKSRSGIAAYVCALLQGILLFSLLYYLPVYFEGVKGSSTTTAGIDVIAFTASFIPCSIVAGAIIRRTGHFRWAIWAGWCILTLASGLLILWNPNTSTYAWVLISALLGMGHGFVIIALNICTQALANAPDAGYAAVLYTFSRSAGFCVGVSIATTVFENALQSHLVAQNLPPAFAASIEGLLYNTHDSSFAEVLKIPISKSFNNVAELMTGIAGTATLISLFIESSSVDKEFKPEHALRRAAPSDEIGGC